MTKVNKPYKINKIRVGNKVYTMSEDDFSKLKQFNKEINLTSINNDMKE